MWKWKGGRTRQKPAPWGELIGGPLAGPSRPEEPNGPTLEGVAAGGSKQENCSTERTDCQGGLWGGVRGGQRQGRGLCMDSCLGISAVAVYAAQLQRRAFHGLTPTAKCWRRFAALLEPRADARGMIQLISLPLRRALFLGKPLLRGMAPGATCCRRLRGSSLTPSFPWAYAHG